jgi:hypothetical protein
MKVRKASRGALHDRLDHISVSLNQGTLDQPDHLHLGIRVDVDVPLGGS